MSEPLKIGFVGLDSSHCVEYAKLLHDKSHSHHVPGARIVAAYAGGSTDWELSYSRVPGFRERMEKEFGVTTFNSIEEVAAVADALMILSVDGRVHFAQFEIVARTGKPVYIDKPLSVTHVDAEHLQAIAQSTGTRIFSSSVWRFSRGLNQSLADLSGSCRHAHLQGQWPLEEGLHGWFYYGIHQVEMLYAAMGPGCYRVAGHRDGDFEVITGFWPDGRIGTIATNHVEPRPFGGWLLGEDGSALVEVQDSKHDRYRAFLLATIEFFRGASSPVSLTETLETIAFLEGAARSVEQGVIPLPIDPHAI